MSKNYVRKRKEGNKMVANLIGISGKIGSGKDTVGNIVNYLIAKKYWKAIDWDFYSLEGDEKKVEKLLLDEFPVKTRYDIGLFVNKKFADKIKDMVCSLIGCSRADLEDREFKEKELSEEWRRYFVTKRGFTTKSYIDKSEIKKYAESTDDLGKDYLVQSEILTPRKLLQLLGTECGRQIIHPNIWVNALFANYQIEVKSIKEVGLPKWIITDVRFPNEAQAIKDRGGIVIRVNRPCKTCNKCGTHKMNCRPRKEHPSETALDDYKEFDIVIDNDGSINDLVEKVRCILPGDGPHDDMMPKNTL